MEFLLTPESLISLGILIILELILGVDNVIFVSLIINRMAPSERKNARIFWLIEGMSVRIMLLFGLSWLLRQKGKAIITIPYIDKGLDLASVVMIAGGLFLMYKSIDELHGKLEAGYENEKKAKKPLSRMAGYLQILLVDMVFSFDSVITAAGTTKHIEIMVIAVIVAMILMFTFAEPISTFIESHPTLQILAVSFLILIGLSLIIEGWDPVRAHELHLKNYIYFAMAFSFGVEMLNMQYRKRYRTIQLNRPKDVDGEISEDQTYVEKFE